MELVQWDYFVQVVDPKRLKELGEGHITSGMRAEGSKGWELVSVLHMSDSAKPEGWVHLFYKRPKQEK